MAVLAMWISQRGAYHFAFLRKVDGCYSYSGNNCGGRLGAVESDGAAIAIMQALVDSGYFLPDDAKMPMKRVGPIEAPARISTLCINCADYSSGRENTFLKSPFSHRVSLTSRGRMVFFSR